MKLPVIAIVSAGAIVLSIAAFAQSAPAPAPAQICTGDGCCASRAGSNQFRSCGAGAQREANGLPSRIRGAERAGPAGPDPALHGAGTPRLSQAGHRPEDRRSAAQGFREDLRQLAADLRRARQRNGAGIALCGKCRNRPSRWPKLGLFFAGNAGRTCLNSATPGVELVAEHRPSASIEAVESGLAAQGYIASRQIATAVYLAQQIEKPILVEGPAGVGKTELAKAIAAWRGLKMIRLQCYEGLDEAKALYEWKYAKQLLYTQILKDKLGEVLGGAATLDAALDSVARFRRRVLLQGIRRTAAAAAGAGAARRLRAPDRRDRQVGCRVRIAAAGNPQRFPGHHSRTRHHFRRRRRRP